MRTTVTTTILLLAALASSPALAQAQLTVVEPGQKIVELTGDFSFLSEAPVERIQGTAPGARGTVTTDPADLTLTRGTISLVVADMKTGNSTRDKHLRSKTWLDAKRHPRISFDIDGVDVVELTETDGVATAQLLAAGRMSLHGVTKQMQVPLTLKWKDTAVKVEMELDVALADFQVEGKKGIVGERVGETIRVAGILNGTVQ